MPARLPRIPQSHSEEQPAAVDDEDVAGDVGRLLRAQEEDRPHHVLGLAKAAERNLRRGPCHLLVGVKDAQGEVRRQNEVKAGFRRMFQDLIQVNEQQKQQAIVQYEAELRKDAQMQRELGLKLAAQDEARQRELKERVRKQQLLLLGETAPVGKEGKLVDQRMYKEALDKQVREHRNRDLRGC